MTSAYTRNTGIRRRLPDDNLAKKKPWHNLLTGWSTDDLTQNREKPNHQYNGGTSNGFPGNGNIDKPEAKFHSKVQASGLSLKS